MRFIMRGLDPRIHQENFRAMDCRVKPGNDDGQTYAAFFFPNTSFAAIFKSFTNAA